MREVQITLKLDKELATWVSHFPESALVAILRHVYELEKDGRLVVVRDAVIEVYERG